MKMIKIVKSNEEKIEAEFSIVQKRSREREISAQTVFDTILSIERRLASLNVPGKYWRGMEFIYENGYKMPNAYNGRPQSTQFKIIRKSSEWYLVSVFREDCNYTRDTVFVNEPEYQKYYKF